MPFRLRVIVVLVGSVFLFVYLGVATQSRIPGGFSGHWWGCLAASLLLIAVAVSEYRPRERKGLARSLLLCLPALYVVGVLLIEKYSFNAWDEPQAYGINVRVP